MLSVLHAGKAEITQPVVRTEGVIAYSPKSRFASRFEAATEGKDNWWEILQEPVYVSGAPIHQVVGREGFRSND